MTHLSRYNDPDCCRRAGYKRGYRSWRAAQKHLHRLQSRNGYLGHVYRCPHCGAYHIGRRRNDKPGHG